MAPYVVQENPSKDDDSWKFIVPGDVLRVKNKSGKVMGKTLRFTAQAIVLEINYFPNNRILQDDDPSKFILALFGELRFPDSTLRETAEYMKRLFKNGVFLNNVQYRFYHHSNSQLRSRSCFLREADSDAELDERIYKLGDFQRIMNIAKRAKRIGLLFSEAEVDLILDPKLVTDIPDLKIGDEIFSDGCGLISLRLALLVSKKKKIIFRNKRYTPSVFQIRYLGYKGVLMLDRELKTHSVQFRDSMKKFSKGTNHTFSVVEHSKPYGFGRLNNDIIVLLSSLGITNEKLLKKQREYHEWITEASQDPIRAVDFLSCNEKYDLAERVLLEGLDNPRVLGELRGVQRKEVARFRKNDRPRAPIMVHQSRLLFGVCDPFGVLREGQVFVRICLGRHGDASIINGDVLVVRNPCLHPGDCLKLRAVNHNRLSHLVDCIVFATVAKPGRRAAPSMSSGGDLDGDKFFVCWDPDLVPSRVAESYDYPPNKDHVSRSVTRTDMANHFASYNNAGLAKVAALHSKWARYSPNRALSPQCQELNALHSQSVDGASIKIPDRLLTPPETTEPYIIDLLANVASEFVDAFNAAEATKGLTATNDDVEETIRQLFRSQQNVLSEYELFNMAYGLARKHSLDLGKLRKCLDHLNIGALSALEKTAVSIAMGLTQEDDAFIWNSFLQSDILNESVLYQKQLGQRFNLQRLYSSKNQGLQTFFSYLRIATQEFTRKVLILKTDDRFSVGIFMRGNIPWDEDPDVADNVVVCSFMKHSSVDLSTFRPCTRGYKLHISDGNFQLYNDNRSNTFVFMTRPPATSGIDVTTSIALQKISQTVQKQVGRLNRAPTTAIELHVVSNRDRVAHQLFDIWFEHVPTEEFIKRTAHETTSYERNNLQGFDWDAHPHGSWLKDVFNLKQTAESRQDCLNSKDTQQLDTIMDLAMEYNAENVLFEAFRTSIGRQPLNRPFIVKWFEKEPQLVFVILKVLPPDDSCTLHETAAPLRDHIVRSIIRSANKLGMATLVALEKIAASVCQIPINVYIDFLLLASLSVRPPNLVQEVLLVLNECRQDVIRCSASSTYVHKHALAVAFDRAEEAADECPCDERGKPKRQRTAPTIVKLSFVEDKPSQVKAAVRVDLATQVRLHSHVRLQAASQIEKEVFEAPILDGIVILAKKGELTIELMHMAPPETTRMDWKMYNAGIIATSRAMMDAIARLAKEGSSCCSFQRFITSSSKPDNPTEDDEDAEDNALSDDNEHLNPSQRRAVQSCTAPLSLIWGPPGTGKTETVVHILSRMLQNLSEEMKILMTASTHNAVDNVLERFLEFNKDRKLLKDEQILRAATDHSKVNKALQSYTIDARVGGDINDNSRLAKQAQKRVDDAAIVFTTCAGSGLGILRKFDFEVVLIDEGSQITEPCALIPLVKGCQRAVIVGDHVQLRPTVGRMAKALEYDVSLLERLYKGVPQPDVRRTMLNIQYRFTKELAAFPSQEFYEGKLKTGIQDSKTVLSRLKVSEFPWPTKADVVTPTVFVQCSSEESLGGQSKSNEGQAQVVRTILSKLIPHGKDIDSAEGKGKGKNMDPLLITVLTPYTKQVKAIQQIIPASSKVKCATIDSFQGRESDIIIFSAVRCNNDGDIGFVEDERRLNVMWTRAKLALIIVGDRRTMTAKSGLWKRAIDSCSEVTLES